MAYSHPHDARSARAQRRDYAQGYATETLQSLLAASRREMQFMGRPGAYSAYLGAVWAGVIRVELRRRAQPGYCGIA